MSTEFKSEALTFNVRWPSWWVRFLTAMVLVYLLWLGLSTALRVKFPWDLYVWSESPFMTNMLKLDRELPIYSSPADANSFVYSPGLDYLTFALLKSFGLHLDIRFCRAVNVCVGLLTAGIAGLCFRRTLAGLVPGFASGRFTVLGAGITLLVIFKNFTSDVTHPDNLVMFHTATLFFLTIATLEKRSFTLAILTMVFAGFGVFAKQILVISFIGPAMILLRHGPWSWRKAGSLVLLGALASFLALAFLWRQPFAKFYTWEVLSRQGLHLTQLYWIILDLLHADRALLWVLALMGLSMLWHQGPAGRRHIELWVTLGVFSVWPNALSYIKQMGTWNNLIIFQLWLLFLVWPAVGTWLAQTTSPGTGREGRAFDFVIAILTAMFVSLLIPTKLPPNKSMYESCTEVQNRVNSDVKAGRKILVTHGTMYLLRAGSREVPLDRANSCLELGVAGLTAQAKTENRIQSRYYDRIYLVLTEWYDPGVLAEIDKNYVVDEVIPKPQGTDRAEFGRTLNLIGDCKVLSRRTEKDAVNHDSRG